MPVNHVKEYLISVHTNVVFSYFYVRASNCSHYFNVGNKCPKLGAGTPEDMLFTNLGVATWFLIFEICIVFSHFSARAWNGPQYSNFGNKCPKLGPGTPEDMLFTNLSVAAWFPGNEIALVCTCILGILLPAANTSAFYSRRYICIYYHYFHAWHHVSCVCVCFCPLCDL